MAGSAADAISKAVERSKQLLFPLKAEKWFGLGFTVFLSQCGEGGGIQVPGSNFGGSPLPTGTSSPGGVGSSAPFQKMMRDFVAALNAELVLYVSLAAAGLVLAVIIWLFVLWFSSRAKLMFVESVIWDRVDVGGQWERAGTLGLSLFKCRALLGLTFGALLLASVAGGIAVGFVDFEAGNIFGSRALVGYGVLAAGLVFLAFPLSLGLLLLDDFVVPLMVVRNVPVAEAWRLCRAEVISGNVGGLMLFYVLRVVLWTGIAMATFVVTCVTCCLTAIPYIGTVLLLPIFVFSRAFPLYYLEELGLQIFPAPEPTRAAYDQWRFPR